MSEEANKLALEAIAALRNGKLELALESAESVLKNEPDHAGASAVQFSALFKTGRFEQARQVGGRAAELNPNSLFILNNQACLQLDANQPAAAAGLLRSLLNQFGERAQWLYNLALAQRLVGSDEKAIEACERTLDVQADHDRAAFQLADCLLMSGRLEEAVVAFNRVRLLRNKHAPSHAQYIHHAIANEQLDGVGLELELAYWRDRFIPKDQRYAVNPISKDGSITLAFTIGAIPSHWLEQSLAPIINNFNKRADSVIVYWQNETLTKHVFDEGVNVFHAAKLDDAEFAKQVRNDQVDALIDLCGLRRGTRQRALGLQLASVQYGWLAHEGGYASNTVKLLENDLPGAPICISKNETPSQAEATLSPYASIRKTSPKETQWPSQTLAARGTHQGISRRVLRSWAAILQALESWKLHLDCDSLLVQKTLIKQFQASGIKPHRLIFNPALKLVRNTIVLDNFINNDPIAISQALRDGGIVVALVGPLFPSQRNASLLSYLDRAHWLCKTPFEYEKRAVDLALEQIDISEFAPLNDSEWEDSGLDNLDDFCDSVRSTLLTQQ